MADDKSGERDLVGLLHRLDPTPELPLTARHQVGLVSLVDRLAREKDSGLIDDERARKVLGLVGERLSLAVGPDGITVHGLLRERHVAWKHVRGLTFTSRAQLVRGGALTRLAAGLARRAVRIPTPGLRLVLTRVVGLVTKLLGDRILSDEHLASLEQTGLALTSIARTGPDVDVGGPLLLVSILGAGFSDAVLKEAERRKIPVTIDG